MGDAIKTYNLDKNYLFVHKKGTIESNFGMDNTPELLENGFGMYSSRNLKATIGPLKSQFFRIGFCRKGSLKVDFGLETFTHIQNTIHFNFPGQLFSLNNVSDDMYSIYILFTAEFIEGLIPSLSLQAQYPFLDYAGVPFFKLSDDEAIKMENLFFEIDAEIKLRSTDSGQAIKHIINLILINAKRSYLRQELNIAYQNTKASSLVVRYKKMVGQHSVKMRTVAEYAAKLTVTAKHLSRVVKEETNRTPSEFIDEMLMMEIKALLRHSDLNISEIAWQLDFSDPSHLSTFFKKHQGVTPVQYRNEMT